MGRLIRISDGAVHYGSRCEAIRWSESGNFKEVVGNKPVVGCSFLVGSYSGQDYWLTTIVTEILEERPGFVKFKTANSEYEFHYYVNFLPNG